MSILASASSSRNMPCAFFLSYKSIKASTFACFLFYFDMIIWTFLSRLSGKLAASFAYNFIGSWEYRDKSFVYYDWMTRDFMKYVSEEPSTQHSWKVMGSGRYITCFGSFQSKAKSAYNLAVEAISKETDYPSTANSKWREIYGSKFPYLS